MRSDILFVIVLSLGIFKFKLRRDNLDLITVKIILNCYKINAEEFGKLYTVLILFQYGRIVSSEVLQGFAPGLALISTCINGLDDGIQNIFIKFAGYTCLRRIKRSCKDRIKMLL